MIWKSLRPLLNEPSTDEFGPVPRPGAPVLEALTGERLAEVRLASHAVFALWPVACVFWLVVAVVTTPAALVASSRHRPASAWFVVIRAILLPLSLCRQAVRGRDWAVLAGLILLLPFMLAVWASLVDPLAPAAPVLVEPAIATPPSVAHPFGTATDGADLARQIVAGTSHTYFASLVATVVFLGVGLVAGRFTCSIRLEPIITVVAETVESIPVLVLLLIGLTVFGWWEDIGRGNLLIAGLWPPARVALTGLLVGLAFAPRLVRLVAERIASFVHEDFVDAAKAHGVTQRRIIWRHIIKKNCCAEVIISVTHIWAAVILTEISLDYLISISPLSGARIYQSWAGMLLRPEVRDALLNYLPMRSTHHWWLYAIPGGFIFATVNGFYILGDGLRQYHRRARSGASYQATRFDGDMARLFRGARLID
jgi:peptide/nickel transport system permease protein